MSDLFGDSAVSWPLVKLGSYIEILSGFAFDSKAFNDIDGLPLIRIRDVVRGYSNTYFSGTYPDEYIVNNGDLLVGMDGDFNREIWQGGEALLNQRVCKITADGESLDQRYLYHFLPKQLQLINAATPAVTVKHLSVKAIKNIEIPLPPLAEQKRIAAILDKADAIRRKRQQAIKLAYEFLRSVFLDMFGDPVSNPKGWEVKSLKDISRIQIGPFGTQLHKEDYVQGGIPLINPTHIVKGHIVPKDDLTITAEKHASLSEYHLEIGDIIIGRRGEMGRCAIVGENEKGWLCGTGSLFIRPNKTGVFSEYLNKLLASDAIKTYLESESQGATMPNLNKTIVGNIQVPVPNDEALNQFSNIKSKIINTKLLYSDFAKEKVFESLNQQAFSGNL